MIGDPPYNLEDYKQMVKEATRLLETVEEMTYQEDGVAYERLHNCAGAALEILRDYGY